MQIVPLQATANQTVTVSLAGQVCQIDVYTTFGGMFVDLYVDNALLIGGVIAETNNRIVRDSYLGFTGDILFIDTQGSDDPVYTGLGTRWFLAYLSPAELA